MIVLIYIFSSLGILISILNFFNFRKINKLLDQREEYLKKLNKGI